VPFIEEVCDQGRIPLETESELVQIIKPDGDAIEAFDKGSQTDHIAGKLAHHIDLKAIFPSDQSLVSHHSQDPVSLLRGAGERNHGDRTLEVHPYAHPSQGAAFQCESLPKAGSAIPGGSAPADHRVVLASGCPREALTPTHPEAGRIRVLKSEKRNTTGWGWNAAAMWVMP